VSGRSSRPPDPPEIRVLDTGCLIELKRLIAVAEQWPMLVRMGALVETGCIAFPRQVVAEMKAAKHPDAPGVWAASHQGWSRHRQPRDDSVAEVLGAAQLTDPNSEGPEPADPYVVAMALEIHEKCVSSQVVVVTEDRIDRMPVKESIVTACERLELKWCDTQEFVVWLSAQSDLAQ
jgi:rRNA maturation endonuclease Nob1